MFCLPLDSDCGHSDLAACNRVPPGCNDSFFYGLGLTADYRVETKWVLNPIWLSFGGS